MGKWVVMRLLLNQYLISVESLDLIIKGILSFETDFTSINWFLRDSDGYWIAFTNLNENSITFHKDFLTIFPTHCRSGVGVKLRSPNPRSHGIKRSKFITKLRQIVRSKPSLYMKSYFLNVFHIVFNLIENNLQLKTKLNGKYV